MPTLPCLFHTLTSTSSILYLSTETFSILVDCLGNFDWLIAPLTLTSSSLSPSARYSEEPPVMTDDTVCGTYLSVGARTDHPSLGKDLLLPSGILDLNFDLVKPPQVCIIIS